jgi:hypothetical protein
MPRRRKTNKTKKCLKSETRITSMGTKLPKKKKGIPHIKCDGVGF